MTRRVVDVKNRKKKEKETKLLPNEKLTRLLLIPLSLTCTTHIYTRVLRLFRLFFIRSKGLCFWKEQDMDSVKLLPCDQRYVRSIFLGSCDSNQGMMSHSNGPSGEKPIRASLHGVQMRVAKFGGIFKVRNLNTVGEKRTAA